MGRLGWSLLMIKAAAVVRRETISGYLTAAGIPVRRLGGLVADWPAPNPATTAPVSADSAQPEPAVVVDLVPSRAPTASACEPYRYPIVQARRCSRNAMAIWQDLVDGHGFTGPYASVRRACGLPHILQHHRAPHGASSTAANKPYTTVTNLAVNYS